jgi:glutamine amidotransferase
MCRIFGFRSVLFSKVHSSLISADNALANQSERHPDGWGVAYYMANTPHLIRSTQSAIEDNLFKKISGIVTSHTVVAHIRKATKGNLNILNTHPFQFGPWIFAHNGNIRDFQTTRPRLMQLINPMLQKFLLGETDSEVIFYIILSEIMQIQELEEKITEPKIIINCIKNAIQNINKIIGPLKNQTQGFPTENYLTFVLTNGSFMLGMQAGQPLYYSTHKKQCPDREDCPFFNLSCENKRKDNESVNHLIISSEPLQGENIWVELNKGGIICVDQMMRLHENEVNLIWE